jgi:hypothetical protein
MFLNGERTHAICIGTKSTDGENARAQAGRLRLPSCARGLD